MCVPMADLAVLSDKPNIVKSSVKAAIVMAASGALTKNPKSPKYPMVGVRSILRAREAIIRETQL